jgi:hypothetical protein
LLGPPAESWFRSLLFKKIAKLHRVYFPSSLRQ